MNAIDLCDQATRAQGSGDSRSHQWLESLRLIKGIVENVPEGVVTTDVLRLLLQRDGGDCKDIKDCCVTEEIGSRIEQSSELNLKVPFQELLKMVRRSSLMMTTASDYLLILSLYM